MGETKLARPQAKELAFRFAVDLVRFLRTVPRSVVERELIRQVTRSGTSIGANIEEAEGARTRREFINSMNVAKRECRETVYWLRLLQSVQDTDQGAVSGLLAQAESRLRILTAIVKTSELRRFEPITHH